MTFNNLLNQIHNQDCVEGLKKIEDGSINLIFADPPFNINYRYDKYNDRLTQNNYYSWSHEWIRECARVLKQNGTFWIAINDQNVADLKIILERNKLKLRSWVIWHYGFGINCTRKFTPSHTHLLYMIKNEHKFTFNTENIRIKSQRQILGDKRASKNGRLPNDVWIIPRVCGTFRERIKGFPCQMPESILERIILSCSNEGEIVLDPFAGSGTTLAIAKKLNRRFIGFEISPNYTQTIKDRLDGIKNPV